MDLIIKELKEQNLSIISFADDLVIAHENSIPSK
jgi:hypothetical protein